MFGLSVSWYRVSRVGYALSRILFCGCFDGRRVCEGDATIMVAKTKMVVVP